MPHRVPKPCGSAAPGGVAGSKIGQPNGGRAPAGVQTARPGRPGRVFLAARWRPQPRRRARRPCSAAPGSRPPAEQTVVVYTSQDAEYAEPIFQEFQKRTGIKVLAVLDGESSKNTGLVARLLARKDNPDCDVFWSGEMIQTARLAAAGAVRAVRQPGGGAVSGKVPRCRRAMDRFRRRTAA